MNRNCKHELSETKHFSMEQDRIKPDGADFVNRLEQVLERVTGVTCEQIVSRSRRQEYVYARMIFGHHLRRHGYTYLRIGSLTRRNHATAYHSVCRYEMDMAFNPAFREMAEEVEKAMKPFMRQAGQKKR